MSELRQYQHDGIDNVARKVGEGKRKIVCQLATGGGKTVMFAGLCMRYLERQDKDILILVHRLELLKQTRATIYEWFGVIAERITDETTTIAPARIYVAMVETINNRLKKNPKYLRNIGMLIVDECHLLHFRKVLEYFPEALTIGYTATPISAVKTVPLNSVYEDIVACVDIPTLINLNSLVPCQTYAAKNINRDALKVSGGDFNEDKMAEEYKKVRHVENAVAAYERHCLGKKVLVFNCNVEHSKIVCDAFLSRNYNARHLDALASKSEREETLAWFKSTPDAILCNIGILTTGFDEPSVEAIIVNRATKSLPLWLQMCGRGARPYANKQFFTIMDLGDNALALGEWNFSHDWKDWFFNPDKTKKGGGVAPIKVCVNDLCEQIISANARVCPKCGTAQPFREPTYEERTVEFVLISKTQINVSDIITEISNGRKEDGTPYNPYYALHKIKKNIIHGFKQEFKVNKIDDATAYKLLAAYQEKVSEWKSVTKRKISTTTAAAWFFEELGRYFNYKPQELSL